MPSPPTQTRSRRARERDRHRHEILDAAEAIFSVKGIAGTTIEDIATRADFAVGTLYNFFSGKDDLIRQVQLRLIKSRTTDIEEQVRPLEHDPIAGLRALTDLWVSHHTRHGTFLKMAFVFRMAESANPGQFPRDDDLHACLGLYEQAGCRFFAAGSLSGVFHPLPSRHLMLIFEGICRAFIFDWERRGETRPSSELARELFAAVHAALTKSHPPPTQP